MCILSWVVPYKQEIVKYYTDQYFIRPSARAMPMVSVMVVTKLRAMAKKSG